MKPVRVLLVEDEDHYCDRFKLELERAIGPATEVVRARDCASGLAAVERHLAGTAPCDLIVVDLALDQSDIEKREGFDILRVLSTRRHDAVVIVWSNWAEDEATLAQRGAVPRIWHRWLEKTDDESFVEALRWFRERHVDDPTPLIQEAGLAGQSKVLASLLARVKEIARTDWLSLERRMPLARLLLHGNVGSGKTSIAYAFRKFLVASDQRPWVEPPAGMLRGREGDSAKIALFGARNFNGSSSKGFLEGASCYPRLKKDALATRDDEPNVARAGTFFLDELQDLSMSDQGLLLSVLNDHATGEVVPAGVFGAPVRVSCHVVCATSEDPSSMERFDPALIDRLVGLEVPPLWERPEDTIPILMERVATRLNIEPGRVVVKRSAREVIEEARADRLLNVRELSKIADLVGVRSRPVVEEHHVRQVLAESPTSRFHINAEALGNKSVSVPTHGPRDVPQVRDRWLATAERALGRVVARDERARAPLVMNDLRAALAEMNVSLPGISQGQKSFRAAVDGSRARKAELDAQPELYPLCSSLYKKHQRH